MTTNNLAIHQTTTSRINDTEKDGWEFSCKECGYLARYMHALRQGTSRLEILNIGDAQVRHFSSGVTNAAALSNPAQDLQDRSHGLTWLTPKSQRRLDEIIHGLE